MSEEESGSPEPLPPEITFGVMMSGYPAAKNPIPFHEQGAAFLAPLVLDNLHGKHLVEWLPLIRFNRAQADAYEGLVHGLQSPLVRNLAENPLGRDIKVVFSMMTLPHPEGAAKDEPTGFGLSLVAYRATQH